MVWYERETPLELTGGKVMEVESTKADPSFSIRTTTSIPLLDRSVSLRSRQLPPHAKVCARPSPPRDRAAQGVILKDGERSNSVSSNLVNSA